MDPQKDNKIQPTTREISTDFGKNVDHVSFFEKDDYFAFVCKKTEKLATASYMVTNLFSDPEPLKWSLRKNVSELLSFIIGYKNSVSDKNSFSDNVKGRVFDIVSSFEVASKSGLISVMNFSILREEFLNLIKILDEPRFRDLDSSNAALPKSFFDIPRNFSSNISVKEKVDQTDRSDTDIKDTVFENKNQSVFKRTNRQNIILGLLKKKKELNIKDISQTIRDCSEKTIQRELISLIDSGVVKKTGERRWSKYSLAT